MTRKEARNVKEEIKGRACSSMHATELIPISIYLGIRPQNIPYIDPNLSMEKKMEIVRNAAYFFPKKKTNDPDYSELSLFFEKEANQAAVVDRYYEWLVSRQQPRKEGIPKLCENIKQVMIAQNLIEEE